MGAQGIFSHQASEDVSGTDKKNRLTHIRISKKSVSVVEVKVEAQVKRIHPIGY